MKSQALPHSTAFLIDGIYLVSIRQQQGVATAFVYFDSPRPDGSHKFLGRVWVDKDGWQVRGCGGESFPINEIVALIRGLGLSLQESLATKDAP